MLFNAILMVDVRWLYEVRVVVVLEKIADEPEVFDLNGLPPGDSGGFVNLFDHLVVLIGS